MKLHEAPSLPRGEKIPKYVEDWIKEVFPLCRNQLSIAVKNRLETGSKAEILATNFLSDDGLLHSAIKSISERIYVLAIKNVEKKEGSEVYESKGNRRKFNPGKNEGEKDGTIKISEEVKRNRFEFLAQKVLQGVGIGYEFNLATFGDALIQDVQSDDSITKKEIEQKDTKTGKFPHPERILHLLLEKHHTQIKIENTLTIENALELPPVFIKDESGNAKKYRTANFDMQVFQLTQSKDLELETYIQDICIGAEGMGYKESLADGSMIFFSVGYVNDSPIGIHKHLDENGADYLEDERRYFTEAVEKNPILREVKTSRHPFFTISAYISGGNVTFDQFKLYRDEVLGGNFFEEGASFPNDFMMSILPDICKKLQADGYTIKGFGNDLDGLVKSGEMFVIGKGIINPDELEDNDLFIFRGQYEVPANITKERLKKLYLMDIDINIDNIVLNEELMGSIENVRGGLYAKKTVYVNLPNLKSVKKLDFPVATYVNLPELETFDDWLEVKKNNLPKVETLNIPKVKVIGRPFAYTSLKAGDFSSVEEIKGRLYLKDYPNASFPKLKICSTIDNESKDHFYDLPELELVTDEINSRCSTYTIPKLKKIGTTGTGSMNLRNVKSVSFPSLEEVRRINARELAEDMKLSDFFKKKVYVLNMPKLKKVEEYSLWGITHIDFSSLNLSSEQSPDTDGGIYVDMAKANVICANRDEFLKTGRIHGGSGEFQFHPNENRFFSSREDYEKRTGKIWGIIN